jgi:UDPglucose 6-dehydrogenase
MGTGGKAVKICVQGLWHLGTVTAACMASAGHHVVGLDFDERTVQRAADGIPPLFEPGLEDLLKQGLASGRLSFSSRAEESVRDIDVLWIAYDTPVDEEDNSDIDFVISQIEKTLPRLRGATVLISSQMPVGSIHRLELVAQQRFPESDISFACSPENLRLGKAIEAFWKQDRIVVGVRSERDRARLEPLFRSITERIEWMSVESAEMTKHAINAFLAMSIAFSNEVASLCERVGADAKEVERGMKSEARIGAKAYVSAGAAFSGGTLARDVTSLRKMGSENGLRVPLISSIKTSNDEHKQWVWHSLQRAFSNLAGTKVAIWGLTYKPGTDTLRGSLAIELCRLLISHGAAVAAHDPVVKQLPADLSAVTMSDNPIAVVRGAHALVVLTEWPQYREIASSVIADEAPGIVVFDANRFLSTYATEHRLRYMAVGMPG